MLTTADFKKGLRILVDGEPYQVMTYSVQTPSARGTATLVKAKVRAAGIYDRFSIAVTKWVMPKTASAKVLSAPHPATA